MRNVAHQRPTGRPRQEQLQLARRVPCRSWRSAPEVFGLAASIPLQRGGLSNQSRCRRSGDSRTSCHWPDGQCIEISSTKFFNGRSKQSLHCLRLLRAEMASRGDLAENRTGHVSRHYSTGTRSTTPNQSCGNSSGLNSSGLRIGLGSTRRYSWWLAWHLWILRRPRSITKPGLHIGAVLLQEQLNRLTLYQLSPWVALCSPLGRGQSQCSVPPG